MKIVRINMSELKITEEPVAEKYERYGGRALTSRIIADEVPADCHPLGARNKLVIATGLLGGTPAPNSGRISIGTKSPLTGGIKESNVGGTIGVKIVKAGIRALIFEGVQKDDALKIVVIAEDRIYLEDASEYRGLCNYALAEKLLERYGKNSSALCVGPAGEQRLQAAAIMSTDMDGKPSRAAGRGGTGAVLGSKGVKAVVALKQPSQVDTYTDKETFDNVAKEFSQFLVKAKAGLTQYGTSAMVKVVNLLGGMPVRNFSEGTFAAADAISGEKIYETIMRRGGKPSRSCHPGCVIHCSNVFVGEDGEYITSSLEYETIVLNGANLDIADLDAIARIDRQMDEIGLDTMETGAALGVAMEAGIIKWGDSKGVLDVLNDVKTGGVTGKLIGSGARTVGRVLGIKRVPEVKGQSLAAYDPRVFKGTGCTCATSPMGSDHTAGPAIRGRLGLDLNKTFEVSEPEGQPELSRDLQIMITVCDSMGYCYFVGPDVENMKRTAVLLNAKYGWDMKYEDVLNIGVSTLNIEKAFNRRAGISPAEDVLPEFIREEPLPVSGNKWDVPQDLLTDMGYDI